MYAILTFLGGFAAGVVFSAPARSLVRRAYKAVKMTRRKPKIKL